EYGITEQSEFARHGSKEGRESPVFVWVGDVAEGLRPVASVVRLQRLDLCDMAAIEVVKPSSLAVTLEEVFCVINGKLSALLRAAGVEDSQLVDEVIEGGPEVVTDLADQDAKQQRWGDLRPIAEQIFFAARLEVKEHQLALMVTKGLNLSFQLLKVFTCPRYALERAIKRMRHEIQLAYGQETK